MKTDIVIGTYNRAPILRRTLQHIVARTRSPYRLHVIDDGSTDSTVALANLDMPAVSVHTRSRRRGISANLRDLLKVSVSDPFVFTDDDVLCPQVAPDWLARLLGEMAARPAMGILALNNPQDNVNKVRGDTRRKQGTSGEVTLCLNVGGTFTMMRRAVLQRVEVPDDAYVSPLKEFCRRAVARGFEVGYLTGTYCQHIGAESVRTRRTMDVDLAQVVPVDDLTLLPPEAFRD